MTAEQALTFWNFVSETAFDLVDDGLHTSRLSELNFKIFDKIQQEQWVTDWVAECLARLGNDLTWVW